jgi:hypothetical protein
LVYRFAKKCKKRIIKRTKKSNDAIYLKTEVVRLKTLRALAPPNPLWSCCYTNLQLHRGAGLSLWNCRDVFGRDNNSTLKNKSLNRLPSFVLIFFIPQRRCVVRVLECVHCVCVMCVRACWRVRFFLLNGNNLVISSGQSNAYGIQKQ